MALATLKPSTGLLGGGKALSVAEGFLTGGPVGAGLALLSANNPKLAGAAGLAGGLTGSKSQDPKPDDNAISRRMGVMGGLATPDIVHPGDHEATIAAGRDALDHPDLPPGVAAAAAPYILGAYHFKGPHQMIDDATGGGEIA